MTLVTKQKSNSFIIAALHIVIREHFLSRGKDNSSKEYSLNPDGLQN